MAQIELARRAQADLVRLRRFLAENNPGAADRASEAIWHELSRLAEFPESAPKREGSRLRELSIRFGRYGYVARYALVGRRVIVLRIFHALEKR